MNAEVSVEIEREVKSLITYVKEYGDSLLRMDGERELQKAIAERAETDCRVKPAHFKKAATAYFKDNVKELREDIGGQLDLLELIQDE
jgi:hypothetical protein